MNTPVRFVEGSRITDSVAELYSSACTRPHEDIIALLSDALVGEPAGPGREALQLSIENLRIASETGLPICQDTGTAIVFIELGNLVCIMDGVLPELVDLGVRRACEESYLRPSQVFPPLYERENTGWNTPAVTHIQHVAGSQVRISLLAKGAGCENVSKSEMLPPLAGEQGILDLAERCVLQGASKACPPVILGIGIGGTLETSGILARKALLRDTGTVNSDERISALERHITKMLNLTGVGPQGFGGRTTVLETRIAQLPCHMASLPVTVCVECHAHRTAACVI